MVKAIRAVVRVAQQKLKRPLTFEVGWSVAPEDPLLVQFESDAPHGLELRLEVDSLLVRRSDSANVAAPEVLREQDVLLANLKDCEALQLGDRILRAGLQIEHSVALPVDHPAKLPWANKTFVDETLKRAGGFSLGSNTLALHSEAHVRSEPAEISVDITWSLDQGRPGVKTERESASVREPLAQRGVVREHGCPVR